MSENMSEFIAIIAGLVAVIWLLAPALLPQPAPPVVRVEEQPPAPASGPRPARRASPRKIVLEAFVEARSRRLEVPELVGRLCCPGPGQDMVRRPTHARAVLVELVNDGVLDLQLVDRETALAGGRRPTLFVSGPRGALYGIATLTISLDEARELASEERSQGRVPVEQAS